MYISAYKNLNVWQKANHPVLEVYKYSKKFPKDEVFGLTSQIRRCAVSVPANIVEGYGRNTKKDKTHFYYISRGSLNELEYYINLAFQLGYFNKNEHEILVGLKDAVGRLLSGFIKASEK